MILLIFLLFSGCAEVPEITSITPSHNSENVPVDTDIVVTFNCKMKKKSITTNTANSNCTGTIQVSADDFITCVRMRQQPATSDFRTWSITPAIPLDAVTNYKIKITGDAERDETREPREFFNIRSLFGIKYNLSTHIFTFQTA